MPSWSSGIDAAIDEPSGAKIRAKPPPTFSSCFFMSSVHRIADISSETTAHGASTKHWPSAA